MKQRIITGVSIAAVVISTFLIGGWIRQTVIFAFILVGLYEVYAIKEKQWPKILLAILIVASMGLAVISDTYILISLLLIMMLYFVISIMYEWFSVQDLSYLFMMTVIFASALKAIDLVVNELNILFMIYLLVVTYMTDTGAYFTGYFFGRHKLNVRISPKKTIEGSIGGWLFGFVFGVLYAYLWVKNVDLLTMVVLSAICPAVGQLGDMAFSAIKRNFGIKDFGSVFPAHGGVLDRIDSLIFNLLFIYIFNVLTNMNLF
jgi:phosphatidate cytidylyltransferase